MRLFLTIALLGAILTTTLPAQAQLRFAYMLYELKNYNIDPPNAPDRTLMGGPYDDLTTCLIVKNEVAREDDYRHVFQCATQVV